MTPKMRRLDGMTIYVGNHRGVGYVVTNAGVWWTHAGHGGVESDDEKAYKKAIQAIEESDGKEQPGKDHKGEAEDQAGGAHADGEGGASVGGGDVHDGGERSEAQ